MKLNEIIQNTKKLFIATNDFDEDTINVANVDDDVFIRHVELSHLEDKGEDHQDEMFKLENRVKQPFSFPYLTKEQLNKVKQGKVVFNTDETLCWVVGFDKQKVVNKIKQEIKKYGEDVKQLKVIEV